MIFINANIPDENFKLKKQHIEIADGIIKDLGENMSYNPNDMIIDCEGFYIFPGFIDIHTHGCVGYDCADADENAVAEISKFLLTQGITSFCPTIISLPQDETEKAIENITNTKEEDGSNIVGINLEGPFLSSAKKGSHDESFLQNPDIELFEHYRKICNDSIKFVTIAPELLGAEEFIEKEMKNTTIAIGHTNAGYDILKKTMDKGVSHITHLFNAMPPLHHREPSVIGAFLESDNAFAEIICDGKHIHKSLVKAMFKLKSENMIIVSDSMRLCGEPEGSTGILGGKEVTLKNSVPCLSNGTLAGSATTVYQEFLNLINWGVPLETALKSATINPAKALKMDKQIGSIKKGKKADIVMMDKDFNIVAVYH
ncbi:MAG: N-acetylglucosamine-6-phosphate deacetylase [Clostridia bacterium]